MKINWILRLKNKPVLTALIAAVVAFVYQILGIVGITPGVSEIQVVEWAGLIVNILVFIGIVTDPSTAGVKDTSTVMDRKEPRIEVE